MEDRSALACLPAHPGQGRADTFNKSSQPLTVQDFLYTVYYIIYITQPLLSATNKEWAGAALWPAKPRRIDTNARTPGRGTRKQNNKESLPNNKPSQSCQNKERRLAASASAGEGLAGPGRRGAVRALPSSLVLVTSWQLCLWQRKH